VRATPRNVLGDGIYIILYIYIYSDDRIHPRNNGSLEVRPERPATAEWCTYIIYTCVRYYIIIILLKPYYVVIWSTWRIAYRYNAHTHTHTHVVYYNIIYIMICTTLRSLRTLRRNYVVDKRLGGSVYPERV
jgi:hypothetical protein